MAKREPHMLGFCWATGKAMHGSRNSARHHLRRTRMEHLAIYRCHQCHKFHTCHGKWFKDAGLRKMVEKRREIDRVIQILQEVRDGEA